MGAIATRMHHAFRNALVVEVEYPLAKMKVVDQKRTSRADSKRVLVVGDRPALRRGEDVGAILRDLMQLAARAAVKLLVVNGDGVGR